MPLGLLGDALAGQQHRKERRAQTGNKLAFAWAA